MIRAVTSGVSLGSAMPRERWTSTQPSTPPYPQAEIVKRSKRNLFGYAPLVYRMALTGFLNLPEPASISGVEWSRERYDLIANQGDIEEALLTVLVSEAQYRAERAARLSRVRMVSRRARTAEMP